MNQVDGVYTYEDYKKVEGYLQCYHPQIALFWAVGVDTGYRVSDILRLTVTDIAPDGRISLVERKTGKERTAYLTTDSLAKFDAFVRINGMCPNDYIFFNCATEKGVKPATRQYVWRTIKQAGQVVGLPRLNLAHIPRARRMLGENWLIPHHLMQRSLRSTTNSNPPRLGMSVQEWNSFLRGMMA